MSRELTGLSEELPMIEVSVSETIFPKMAGVVSMEAYPILLKEIRQLKTKRLFVAVNYKTQNASSSYLVGIVADVISVNSSEPLIFLKGQYRAELKTMKRIKPGIDYWTAILGERIEDERDNLFINGVVRPDLETKLVLIFSRMKSLLYILFDRCMDFMDLDLDLWNDIFDQFEDSKLYQRNDIDSIIWEIIYVLPYKNYAYIKDVLEQRSLCSRIFICIDLIVKNIEIVKEQKSKIIAAPKRKNQSIVKNESTSDNPGESPDDSNKNVHPEIAKRWKRYKEIESTINPEGQKALISTFEHLKVIGSPERSSSDWSTHLNYTDVLLSLFSCVTSQQETDIVKVESILGPSHYGMEKIKERIYNYLTAKILNPRGKGPTPCFVGPPGVGKTSIGKSIAESLGRRFIRLSLGGIRDEAEIRGHRRTYIGAVPGKIIEQLKRSGVKNPVFMLDEIDKISKDGHGDPAAALLEVLDPEQNHSFRDNYVDVPYDLSEILFLCTANVASGIPHALMDRMEIIPIAGYTEFEKIQIAKKYLIPEQIAETGFPGDKVEIVYPDNDPDRMLSKLISGYTREAGVRGLKRELYRFLSAWNRRYLKIAEDKRQTKLLITDELIEELLGLARDHEQVNVVEIGEAIGLAWTEVGGEILYIHAELTPHIRTEKDISQTGNLSRVFQEANHNALTVVKNLLRNDKQAMDRLKNDLLCLSVPDLGIEKDGPSAGITMATAIYSELTDKLCKPYLAMTGELTIKGRVRAIGGVKEKILAAQRAGIKEIILPESNKRNIIKDIPEEIKDKLKFYYASRIEEVIEIAFTNETPA